MDYECVCENCGNVFESNDEDATLCPDCWNKIVAGEGKDSAENQ